MARSKLTARKSTSKPPRLQVVNEREAEYKAKNNVSYDTIVKENALFEKYYRQLKLIDESEFDEFMTTLKRPLPITFRITSYKSFSKELLKTLKEKHFKYLDEIVREENGELVKTGITGKSASLLHNSDKEASSNFNSGKKIYKSLEWYPDEMAWQVELSRQDVRKNVHFEEFKQFLMQQTQSGYISRQEAVSMIPPLMLDIKPEHQILDMCAAPGSKTAQLIEFLHKDKSNPCPDGFVIANELDNKRCYLLMHQLKRLESPNFMIINHDASSLPNIRTQPAEIPAPHLTYDRILADVPCSGDGTFRKNIDVWAKWNFAHACNLHGIQARIANRSVELLKPGGLMVYSTCSLNPIENEAVVYNLLLKHKGQLELVESRDKLPGLKTLNGLYTWNCMNKTGDIYNTAEDVPEQFKHLVKPYMFPPELSVAQELHLERCIRVMPHHQDTGGFFIAVIRKLESKKTDNTEETNETSEKNAEKTRVMKAPPAKRLKHVYEENPFQFLDSNNQLLQDWSRIKEFFQISDEFPVSQMMTRNKKGENVRNVYFVSKQIRELTVNNGDRIKFINMGVPLFSKADIKDPSNIELRISQESLDIVMKYFGKRIIFIENLDDLIKLLQESNPGLNDFSEDFQTKVKEKCDNQGGSVILIWQTKKEPDSKDVETPISFTAWLGKYTLRPLINIELRRFFMSMIGVDSEKINEVCNKIKAEDEANSKKSIKNNPQHPSNKNLQAQKDDENVPNENVDDQVEKNAENENDELEEKME